MRKPLRESVEVTSTIWDVDMRAEAIQAAIEAVGAITDPAERARAATDALKVLHDGNATLASLRRTAVAELQSQGMSYRQIGPAIGVNHTRVGQILSGEPTGIGVAGRKSKAQESTDAD